MNTSKKQPCLCTTQGSNKKKTRTNKWSALNILSAVVFFLFPKCAFCWAAYASFFSYIGLGSLEYNSQWRYVILGVFLLGSLILMYKHYKNKSWMNILVYTLGLTILLGAYYLNYKQTWLLYIIAFLMIISNFHLRRPLLKKLS